MPREITNNEDIIDSRDVIARVEELEAERDDYDGNRIGGRAWEEDFHEEAVELRALRKLAEEAEGYANDWHHGEVLIRDSYFTDYAQQLADDIGAVKLGWPHNCIDWKQAARELKMDYAAVKFDGVTYWIR